MKIDPAHYPLEKLKEIINNLPTREKQIAVLAYATGSRVSELNQITPEDITEDENYLYISCKVLKKRTYTEKNTKRVALIRQDETWLIISIKLLLKETKPFTPLVPLHRATIFRILKKSTGINPHSFRAIRATHLATKFHFTAHQLKKFFGWSSVAPSDFYVSMNVEDIKY
jgi:integrase